MWEATRSTGAIRKTTTRTGSPATLRTCARTLSSDALPDASWQGKAARRSKERHTSGETRLTKKTSTFWGNTKNFIFEYGIFDSNPELRRARRKAETSPDHGRDDLASENRLAGVDISGRTADRHAAVVSDRKLRAVCRVRHQAARYRAQDQEGALLARRRASGKQGQPSGLKTQRIHGAHRIGVAG